VGAAPIDAYRVETSLAATGPWTLVTSTTQLSYHVVLPYQDDLRRYYRVTAHNSHGFGAPAVTSIPGAAGPVSGIHVVPGSTTLALTWNAPADDGGAGITGYSVQWQQIDAMGNPVGSQGFANTSATHYTVTGLTNGVIYQLTIAANNGVTGGAAEPFGAVPGVPYGTHITHATPTRTSASTVDVAVAWTAPTGDGGSPLTGYQVQIWDENPASTSPLAAFTASSSATGHTFSGLGLTAGVHYVAVVQPFNANNSGASAPGYADVAEFLTP
jgi:titin